MADLLTAAVQVVSLHNVVWYMPEGFDVQTDATILDQADDLLMVTNGWAFKVIARQQVTRTYSPRQHETHELYETECEDYDEQI